MIPLAHGGHPPGDTASGGKNGRSRAICSGDSRKGTSIHPLQNPPPHVAPFTSTDPKLGKISRSVILTIYYDLLIF